MFYFIFPPNRGYLAEYAYQLINGLARNENIEKIVILADKIQSPEGPEKVVCPEKVKCVRCWTRNKPASLLGILSNLRRFSPDIVHFNCGLMSWGKAES
jgi:hypothetical protein